MTGPGPRPCRPPCRPWLAGGLGGLVVGLGHVYAGRPLRALVMHLLGWAAWIAMLGAMLAPILRPPGNVLVPVATAAGVWLLLVGDGIACARSPADTRRPHALSVALAFVVAVIADEALAATIRGSFAQAFTIASRSMEPGMALGDRVLVDMRATATAAPSRGDLVIFRYPKEPEKSWVKRIGGLPGETVEVRDKRLLVDGEERTELPAVYVAGDAALPHSPRDQLAPTTIPVDEYFVVGDNRDRSYDSRFWGTVPRRYLLCKARLVYFSWDAEAHAIRWSRIGTTLD